MKTPIAFLTAGIAAIMLSRQAASADTWQEMRDNPNANFYDILAAHRAEQAAAPKKTADGANAELFEELEDGGDYKFERWRDYVEVRVQPSGELSQLSMAALEMRKWMGLDGQKVAANSGSWTLIGPTGNPIGPGFTGIPNGVGRLNFIRFHPIDKNFLLVGSPGGGLWISRDGGESWSPSTDRIAVLGVADAAVDPKNPEVIYITTGDRDGGDTRSIGVLKSTDGGKTWSTTGLTWDVSAAKKGGRLLVHPVTTNVVLHGGSDGVYRSTDGGATFTKTTGITELVRAMEFKPGDPSTVYAAGGKVYYSNNAGETWTAATGPSTLSSSRIVLAVSPAAPEKIWSYTSASNLHVSSDGGRTYTFVGKGATPGQSTYNLSVAVSHTDPNYIVTGQVQMKKSMDGGRTWSEFQSGAHWDVHGLEFLPGTNTLFGSSDGGVYRSLNGGNWGAMNAGLQISEMYRIGVSRTDPNTICNGLQDNGTLLLTGTSQHRIGGADGFECFFDYASPSTIYTETQNGSHSRCTWNGANASCTSVGNGLSGSGSWNTAWGMDPKVSTTVYTTRGATLYKSTNRGTNWSALGAIGGSGSIKEFTISPSNTSVIYVLLGSAVYRTENGGTDWSNRSTGISGTPTYLAVHRDDPNKIWVSVSGYTAGRKAYRSTDGGQNWTNFSEGLPNLPANAIVSEGNAANGIYLGMDVGVYYRDDNLTTWQPFFDGLPNVSVRELEIGGTGPTARLKAATYGRGAWHTPLWGQTVHVRKQAGEDSRPALSDFRVSFAEKGRFLDCRFQLSGVGPRNVTVLLATLDGRIVYRQAAPGTGLFSRRIDLSGHRKGTYLLTIEGTSLVRRIAVL